MNKRSSSKISKTDWARLRTMKDKEIRLSAEHPEADPAYIVRGIVRRGLQPVTRKEAISLRVDADVLAWFREQGPGWQTRMNAVLKAFKEAAAQQARPATHRARNRKRATL
ncbi:MAG: BrnA antitoxin family protein [Blastocatellia bacterium]